MYLLTNVAKLTSITKLKNNFTISQDKTLSWTDDFPYINHCRGGGKNGIKIHHLNHRDHPCGFLFV